MRDLKYRIHNMQKKTMRIVASAACVLGVLAVCLGVVGYRNNLKADTTLPVMTRGVIDKMEQIPQTKRDMYDKKDATTYSKGTKENPFLVLEIVPYEEYAEFGYQISGCEPTDVDTMRYTEGAITTIAAINGASYTKSNAYFFQDEPEYQKYKDKMAVDSNGAAREAYYKGYYEKVEKGKGTFSQELKQDTDGNTRWEIVRNDNGENDIIWHTVNSFEEDEYKDQSFDEDTNQELSQIGSRIYTKRKSKGDGGKDNVCIIYNYYAYKNPDYFLKESLKLSEEEAENYSIIIKTITPAELNNNPDWITYADLFVVSASKHDGNIPEIWKKYRKLTSHHPHNGDYEDGFESKNSGDNRDISWDVALKMYKKINADENYAPIVMDSFTYHPDKFLKKSKSVTLNIFDWNMKDTGATYTADKSYNNNMYKLAVMLFSMDAKLFEKLYLSGDNPLIQDGKFTLEKSEDAQLYWNQFTFLPTGSDGDTKKDDKGVSSWYSYWTNNSKWKDYGTAGEITSESNQQYVNNRMFVYKNDTTTTSTFGTGKVAASDKNSVMYDFKKFLEDENITDATPADAVRYILGYRSDSYIRGDLKVLDLEPCYDSKNGYSLKESYIRLMIPKFVGDITITHMTTAEFIGSAEDLNSTYNMIFIGTDVGAYNLDSNGKTVWNDTTMNGKIYFHTGDKMEATDWKNEIETGNRDRSVKFIDGSDGKKINSSELRFSGNDITEIKKNELKSFLSAGYPIVAMPVVYNTDNTAIDQHSILCSFIQTWRTEGSTLCNRDDISKIENVVRAAHPSVDFEKLPNIYDGTTDGVTISHPNYLERDDKERSILPFKFTVKDEDKHEYGCRIYMDQNQDGKFDSSECSYTGDNFLAGKEQRVNVRLSRLYSGIVQWKIEVYQVGNENIRFVKTGCSAAENITGIKKKIRVLQIMPRHPLKDDKYDSYFDDDQMKYVTQPYPGYLNLSTFTFCSEDKNRTGLFKKFYDSLNDYEITVDVYRDAGDAKDEYDIASIFCEGSKFTFDDSEAVSAQNPATISDKQRQLFNNYDMIIVGFGDYYGGKDISNTYGAVDFIKYFIASGKSVLFTHDLTSLYNMSSDDFGYSANTYLRDTMGMNRYGAVYHNLTAGEKTNLNTYQNKKKYDTVTDVSGNALDQKQGFTYYAMKRLGFTESNDQKWKNQKMPYKYMITSSRLKSDGSEEPTCGYSDLSRTTGFNNNNDLTTKVTKTNTGQITEYPYKIGTFDTNNKLKDTSFSVSSTHGQWYQLDMEDPEITVWYCLADDNKYSAWQDKIVYNDKEITQRGDSNNPGTAGTYGVSPNDAANNYYIYSKGNVYYSGVGHSSVTGDMEAKLFINTMIAAYRASYQAPMVEIMNESAKMTSSVDSDLTYEMTAMTEYGSEDTGEVDNIEFSPVELNAITTKLSCSIKYDNGSYVKTIYKKGSSTPINAVEKEKGVWVFEGVKNMKEYYFKYEGSNTGNVHFEIWNDKVDKRGKTDLTIDTQNLFLLD